MEKVILKNSVNSQFWRIKIKV